MSKVLIYDDDTSARVFTIERLLRTVALKGTGLKVEFVHPHDFMQKLTEDTLLFVLPGAAASATYREQITGEKLDLLRARTQSGIQLLGICAGAYTLSNQFEYCFYNEMTGTLEERRQITSSLGLAPVFAFGPNTTLHPLRPYQAAMRRSTYDAVEINFNLLSGQVIQPTLALAKGPSFSQLDLAVCQPLALYKKTGEIAMVSFNYGQGGGVLSGPAPEVGGLGLIASLDPKMLQRNPQTHDTLLEIERSHQAWAVMWSDLLARLLPTRPDLHLHIARNLAESVHLPPPLRPTKPNGPA